jgi:hypothetical protein
VAPIEGGEKRGSAFITACSGNRPYILREGKKWGWFPESLWPAAGILILRRRPNPVLEGRVYPEGIHPEGKKAPLSINPEHTPVFRPGKSKG